MAQREIEIDEALAAVEDALDCLDAAARDLKSARNWGLLDMLGGGFWISAFKQGRMQTAQEHLNAAQRALSRLADERTMSRDSRVSVPMWATFCSPLTGCSTTFSWTPWSSSASSNRVSASPRQLPSAKTCAISCLPSGVPIAVQATVCPGPSRGRGNYFDGLVRQSCRSAFGASRISPM